MKILNIIILFLLCLSIYFFIPNNKITPSYTYIEDTKAEFVFFVQENELVGVPLAFKAKNQYQKIEEAFNYLTSHSNRAPLNVETYLIPSIKMTSYDIFNDAIYLTLDDNLLRIEENKTQLALGQIYYTYSLLGYQNVYLKSDDEVLKEFNGYPILNGLRQKLFINLTVLETEEAKMVSFFYPKKNYLGLVNYAVSSETDTISFLLSKISVKISENEDKKFIIYGYEFGLNKIKIYVNDLEIANKYASIFEKNFKLKKIELLQKDTNN